MKHQERTSAVILLLIVGVMAATMLLNTLFEFIL
jgi:hypothetical protein